MVDAIGEGVTNVAEGDRVVALTNFGSYSEYIFLGEEHLVHVPATLDPAEAVVLVLIYLVAYQILHQVVKVKSGDRALLVGASGGVGTAFLQLGKLADIKLYGLASPSKHNVLTQYGATPIDYHTQNFIEVIWQVEPEGLDYVFNWMGEEYFAPGMQFYAVAARWCTMVGRRVFHAFCSLLSSSLYSTCCRMERRLKAMELID
jgi:NADPH:quinone reductase-like Zn-dependent oxidoreductase